LALKTWTFGAGILTRTDPIPVVKRYFGILFINVFVRIIDKVNRFTLKNGTSLYDDYILVLGIFMNFMKQLVFVKSVKYMFN